MTLTVAICTRNRTEKLKRAVQSLFIQKRQPDEILVVDNAPDSDSGRRLIEEHFPQARYIQEPVLGLDFARNRALHESRADIVAFLDDDCVADASWVDEIIKTFQRGECVCVVTGKIVPLSLETDAQRLFEANGGYGRGDQLIQLPADCKEKQLHGKRAPLIAWAVSVGNGSNFALRRECALKIKGFDEAFDLGEAFHGGGDLDIFWRLLVSGYDLVYQPRACVKHEHRRDMQAMTEQLAAHQQALAAFLVKSVSHSRGFRRIILLQFLLWRLCKPGLRLALRGIGKDPLPARVLWRMWKGVFRGLRSYRRACSIAQKRREQEEGLA